MKNELSSSAFFPNDEDKCRGHPFHVPRSQQHNQEEAQQDLDHFIHTKLTHLNNTIIVLSAINKNTSVRFFIGLGILRRCFCTDVGLKFMRVVNVVFMAITAATATAATYTINSTTTAENRKTELNTASAFVPAFTWTSFSTVRVIVGTQVVVEFLLRRRNPSIMNSVFERVFTIFICKKNNNNDQFKYTVSTLLFP